MQQRLTQLRRLRRRALRANPAVLAEPARKEAKAFFRSTNPARLRSSGDDSKAAPLRQPLLSRHCLDLRCFFFSPTGETVSRASVGRRWPAFGASPEERSNAGAVEQKNALAFFCAGVVSTAVVGTKCPTPRQGSSAQRWRAAMTYQLRPTLRAAIPSHSVHAHAPRCSYNPASCRVNRRSIARWT